MKRLLPLLSVGLLLLGLVAPALSEPLPRKNPIVPVPDHKIRAPLSAEEQRKHFLVPEGFEVELVAAEPLVINPITMTLDEQGRIYVSESHTYRYGPKGSPVKPFSNPIVRLEPLPDGKGYKRVVVAEGFDDPVMGMAIRQGKLWVTANNYLYLYDLGEDGKATNRRTLLTDKNKAWNPFGMFVLEWGPDGLLYISVGNHAIDIGGPTNRVSSRGSSGIIARCKPDGSDLERLVHGLRVPYSFEYDPFGQLWLLSNGEGNPNRFVRVIEGVDYQCFSRPGVDNSWLAGEHPLAPPCFELMRGACTQLVRYYAAGFPVSYQGSLFLDNWGAHGFNGPNRAVLRFIPDARGSDVVQESFLACCDPHFRPSHIVVAPDGSLLVSDWYGRDDESDMTGRIWRVRWTGKDRPVVAHELGSPRWKDDDYALSALGSPDHLIREKAMQVLEGPSRRPVAGLAEQAATAKEALGAANALWTLVRIGTPEAKEALAAGGKHTDWRVRRLALRLLRRYQVPAGAALAQQLAGDADPAVRLEAALDHGEPAQARVALLDALRNGAAGDVHLRYEAAWHLARSSDQETFSRLLKDERSELRLAGLIALDVACYENFPSKPAALESLGQALGEPGRGEDLEHLLALARLNWDKVLTPALEKLLARSETPAPIVARALLVLRGKSASVAPATRIAAGKRLLQAVERGEFRVSSPADTALLLEFLESEGPSPSGLKQLGRLLNDSSAEVRAGAHSLVRRYGAKVASLAETLWPRLLDARARPEDRVEVLATLAEIEPNPVPEQWEKLLHDTQPRVRTEAVRCWRAFKGKPELTALLVRSAPALVKETPRLEEDLAVVLAHLEADPRKLGLTMPSAERDALAETTLAALPKLPVEERSWRALAGRRVFERSACVKCHTTVTENVLLAPSLKGVSKGQKPDYLVESVLYPSKIIKTGYETEQIVTKQGKTLTGLVKDEGAILRVVNAEGEVRVPKADIETRAVQKLSLMPEGQEKFLSREEFLDLIVYLQSLR